MMELSCEVILDLLPLYAEKMTSAPSDALIQAHLADCPACRQQLAQLQTQSRTDAKDQRHDLQSIQKELKKRRLRIAALAAFLVALAALSLFSLLTQPIYLPYSGDTIFTGENADGSVFLCFRDAANYSTQPVQREDGAPAIAFAAWTTRWSRITKADAGFILTSEPMTGTNLYYSDCMADGQMTLLYSTDGQTETGGWQLLPRLVLGYYLLLAAVAAGALGLACLLLGKRPAIRKNCFYLFLLPCSYCVGHLAVKGFGTLSFSTPRDFVMILIAAALAYGAACTAAALFSQIRRDRQL